jgi:hypothetical protein
VIVPLACALVEVTDKVRLLPGSRIAAAYGASEATEGYRCRYGLNEAFRATLVSGALRVTAEDEAGDIRALELQGHPFFVATLFQPERAARRAGCRRWWRLLRRRRWRRPPDLRAPRRRSLRRCVLRRAYSRRFPDQPIFTPAPPKWEVWECRPRRSLPALLTAQVARALAVATAAPRMRTERENSPCLQSSISSARSPPMRVTTM